MSEIPVPRAVAILENALAEAGGAIADCFAVAKAVAPETDEYGHHRAREIENAAGLLKMTAEVGLALARIRGEFNHNITVTRTEAAAKT